MWQRTVWARFAAFLLHDVEHAVAKAEPARQMHHQRQAGPHLRAGGAAQGFLLVGGEVGGDADLADQADLRVGAVDAVQRLGHDLVGDVVDRQPRHLGGCEDCR